jgi:gas vesicle protein
MAEQVEQAGEAQERAGCPMGSFLLGLGIGAVVGAAAALLLAPQPGSETRKSIADATERAKTRLEELTADMKTRIEDLSRQTKELAEAVKTRFAAAVEAGKEAAAEKKEELSSAVAEETAGEA